MASSWAGVTTAELEALRTQILASLGRGLNAQSYTVGARTLTRASLREQRELLREVCQEIDARTDQTGGVIFVEFGEPS